MIAVGLIDFDHGGEVLARRIFVRVRLLEIEHVLATCFDEAVDVEHRNARTCLGLAQPFQHHGFHDHSGDAGAGRAGAEEQHALILHLAAGDPQRAEDADQRRAGGALDVVVVAADLVAIAREQPHRVDAGPILEMDAAARKHLLHRRDELGHERIALGDRGPRRADAEIQRIVEQAFVVGAEIDHHRKQHLRRHAGTGGVELQLADRNAHAVGAEVAEAEDALAAGGADEAHVLVGPIAQDLLHPALVLDRDVHAARPPEDVAELQAGLADGRIVDDRQEARRIGHQGPVEQGLVVIEKSDQIDVAVDVAALVPELLQHALELHGLAFDDVGKEPGQAQRLALGFRERGRFVAARILQEVHALPASQRVRGYHRRHPIGNQGLHARILSGPEGFGGVAVATIGGLPCLLVNERRATAASPGGSRMLG